MALNTLTLTIETETQPRACLTGQIKGWDREVIVVAESGPLTHIKAVADYYVRSFENVKIDVELL